MPAFRTLLPALARLLGAAAAAWAQERPHLSADPEVSRARALIDAGSREVALAILRPRAAAGGAEYRWPLGDSGTGSGSGANRWRLRLGGDFSRVEHGHRAFDRTSLSVHAGPHWLADADTALALLVSLRRHLAAGEVHSREAGLRFEADRRLSRRLTVQARASWHRRVHAWAGSRAFDGPVTTAALGIAWLATPQLRPAAARAARRAAGLRLGRVDLLKKIPDLCVGKECVAEQPVRHWDRLWRSRPSPKQALRRPFARPPGGTQPQTSTNSSRSARNPR